MLDKAWAFTASLLMSPDTAIPSVKRVVSINDMCALWANEETDLLIERLGGLLWACGLVLADDVDGVRRATAEELSLTRALQATVWIHTVHQAICTHRHTPHLTMHIL